MLRMLAAAGVAGLMFALTLRAGPAEAAQERPCFRTFFPGGDYTITEAWTFAKRLQKSVRANMSQEDISVAAEALFKGPLTLELVMKPWVLDGLGCRICDPSADIGEMPSDAVGVVEWTPAGLAAFFAGMANAAIQLNPNVPELIEAQIKFSEMSARVQEASAFPLCQSLSEQANKADLASVAGEWLFMVPTNGTVKPGTELTTKKGKWGYSITNPPHFNEVFWWRMDGKTIVLLNGDGIPTSRLSRVTDVEYSGKSAVSKDTIQLLRDEAPAPPAGGGAGGGSTATAQCYKGATVHTGGPRKGKVFKTKVCIDWGAPGCAITGKGITGQTVVACDPGVSIEADVAYANGKSVVWDLGIDPTSGDLNGKWKQSDGARGIWKPE